MENFPADEKKFVLIGRNAVSEALKSGREIDHVLIAKGNRTGSILKILADCRERSVLVKEADIRKLDSLAGGNAHQGIIAFAASHQYAEIDELFSAASDKNEPPFIIICDEIEDPHNLGAIIRTADASGAHGIIIPKRRSAGLTPAVSKSASGALEHIKIARVSNLAAAVDELKARGLWIYGADMDGQSLWETDFSGAVGLVIGSEGNGLGQLIKKKCDFIVSLPMQGRINSLNASVAGGIIMYEVLRYRVKGRAFFHE